MYFGNGDLDNCPPGQYPHFGANNEYAESSKYFKRKGMDGLRLLWRLQNNYNNCTIVFVTNNY